jgi:hypothetical protein
LCASISTGRRAALALVGGANARGWIGGMSLSSLGIIARVSVEGKTMSVDCEFSNSSP